MQKEDCLAFEIHRQCRRAVRIQSVWRRQQYACNLVALKQYRVKETARSLWECQQMRVEDWYVKQRLRYDTFVYSASRCQATWRGHVIRCRYQRERAQRNEERASFSIQRLWRGYQERNHANAVRRAKEQWSRVHQLMRRDEAWLIRRFVGLRKQKNQSLLKRHMRKLGLDLHSYRFSRKDIWNEIARDRKTVEADLARRSYALARSLSVPRNSWLKHAGMKYFAGFRQAMLERKASEATPTLRHLSSPPSLLSSRSAAPPWSLRLLQWSKEWMQDLAFDREAFVYTLEHQQRERLREETQIRRGDVVKIVGPSHKHQGCTGRVVRLDSKGEAAGLELDPLLLYMAPSSSLSSTVVLEHPPDVVHSTTTHPPPATLVFTPLRHWGKEYKPNPFDEARPMLCRIRQSSEELQRFPLLASRQRHHLTPEWRAELLDRAYRERLFLELNGRATRLQALVRGWVVRKSSTRTRCVEDEDRLYAHVLRRCRGNAHMADTILFLRSQWRPLRPRRAQLRALRWCTGRVEERRAGREGESHH